ncbi:hypothetical protein [Pandoraea sputorum]|uniref:hypothetical protein n=1 Tax=Pandoraea sputorum TaxID=93222 RepID=UPI0012409B8B|nr:hypothetical protein [Pandoraea sputorum]
MLNQLFNAQAAQDDVVLATATAALQRQAQSLHDDEAMIAKIIGDAALAAKIIGFLTRAATALRTL